MTQAADDKPKRKGIREQVLRSSISAGDANDLFAHLHEIGFDAARADEFVDLLRRTGPLVLPRADASTDARRDAFLADVRARLAAAYPGVLEGFDAAETLLRRAEVGYRRILGARSRLPVAQMAGEVIAAGLLLSAQRQLTEIAAAIEAALQRDGLFVQGAINIGKPGGPLVDPDAANHLIVRSLGGALIMEAYARGWFAEDGSLHLPDLPSVDEAQIAEVQQDAALGFNWVRWQRQEETARYHGGRIDEVKPGDLGISLPAEISCALRSPCVEDGYDYAANLRAGSYTSGNAYDTLVKVRGDPRIVGVDVEAALPPVAFVSEAEIVQSLALSEKLGYEVLTDTEEPGGMRLALWIRGYAALAVWAERQGLQPRLLQVADPDLMALLKRVSLSEAQARLFLTSLTFGRRSRDLFDTPLLRTGEQGWVVVAPAVVHAHLASVIPSMLAQRRVQLKRKGHAFNERVLELFKDQGLDAHAIEEKRGKEIYDYDVLVPWGDYLFLFECKNHGLSGNDPVEALHFRQELLSTVAQVKRLLNGLQKHPDILTDVWGPDILEKAVVPCILHNETYARDGDIDGIHVYDFSALGRFFKSGAFHVGHDHRIGDQTFRVQAETRRIWTGDAPNPGDLIAQLKSPFQLEALWPEVQCVTVLYQLDETTAAAHELLTRKALTEDERIAASGAAPEAVKAQLAKGDAAIAELKAKLGKP